MDHYVRMGLIVGGGAVVLGAGYWAVRRYLVPPIAFAPSGQVTTVASSSGASSMPATFRLPTEMSGEQVAAYLKVPFSALVAANPGDLYMRNHKYALLKAGTTLIVPASAAPVPSSAQHVA